MKLPHILAGSRLGRKNGLWRGPRRVDVRWDAAFVLLVSLVPRIVCALKMDWLVDEAWGMQIMAPWLKEHFWEYVFQFQHTIYPPQTPVIANPPLPWQLMTVGVWLAEKVGVPGLLGARLVNVVITGATCLLTYHLGKRCCGRLVGLVAALLLACSPTFVAVSVAAIWEPALAFEITLAAICFYEWLHDRRPARLYALAASLGLVLVTKFASAVLLLGSMTLAVAILLVFDAPRGLQAAKQGAIFLLVMLVVPLLLWSGARDPRHLSQALGWLVGRSSGDSQTTAMFAEYTLANGGLIRDPMYYVWTLFGSTTPPVAVLALLTVVMAVLPGTWRNHGLEERCFFGLLLLNVFGVLPLFGVFGGHATGVHRIAFLYPLLMLLAAQTLSDVLQRFVSNNKHRMILVVMLLLTNASPLVIWSPSYYIAYNNVLIGGITGGSRHYRVGYGEGMRAAGQWLSERVAPDTPISTTRFAWVLQQYVPNRVVSQPFNATFEQTKNRCTPWFVIHNAFLSGGLRPAFAEELAGLQPAYVVSVLGVPYIWIYQLPSKWVDCVQRASKRFGVWVDSSCGDISDYPVEAWHLGWYGSELGGLNPPHPRDMQYVQVIPNHILKRPDGEELLRTQVRQNPAALWIVGIFPESPTVGKGYSPEKYAQIYHDAYTLIKRTDQSAQVAIGGVMQPTPLRLKWLDGVLQAYEQKYGKRLPVDVWNIYVWILPERANSWGAGIPVGLRAQTGELYSWRGCADSSVFAHLVRQFRKWMQAKGEQNKPLIVQYGVSQPVSYVGDGDPELGAERIKTFMLETFDFLLRARDAQIGLTQDDYRLVQRWLWWSLNEPAYDFATGKGAEGALFECDDPTALTALGHTFDEYMRSLPE